MRAISGWDGLPTGFVGVMRDVTDERRAQQHVAAEQAVMRALTTMESLEDAGPALLEILGAELGWDGAELWRWGTTSGCAATPPGPRPAPALDRFMRAGDWLAYEVGDGFPGMAWMSRVPIWKADITERPRLVRREEGLADGVRSTVALPLRANGVPVGVIVLVSRTPRETEGGLDRLLEAIGGQVTQFLQRREAEAPRRRAGRRSAGPCPTSPTSWRARTTCSRRATRSAAPSATSRAPSPWSCSSRPARTRWPSRPRSGAAVLRMSVELDGRSVTAEAYLTGELIHVADVIDDARAASCQAVAGSASAAWVPVVRDGRPVGVLAVGWAEHRAR